MYLETQFSCSSVVPSYRLGPMWPAVRSVHLIQTDLIRTNISYHDIGRNVDLLVISSYRHWNWMFTLDIWWAFPRQIGDRLEQTKFHQQPSFDDLSMRLLKTRQHLNQKLILGHFTKPCIHSQLTDCCKSSWTEQLNCNFKVWPGRFEILIWCRHYLDLCTFWFFCTFPFMETPPSSLAVR